MVQPTPHTQTASLIMLESMATIVALGLAFLMPRLGTVWFTGIERSFSRLARRKGLSVAVVAIVAFLLRLALLPICHIPLPFVPDDFSFLLSADTFAHGRLTNPTPAMWMHFESIHLTLLPTYMSMYFPSTGLLLVAGKVLFGQPWYGLLIASALMCAAICWMLQAWLPPTWALLGGVIAILRLGLFSYWINTYSGGGSLSAIGGALILGSLPRLKKTMQLRYGVLLATGISLLAITRPYEGLLLCLPSAAYLAHWLLFDKKRPRPAQVLRVAALPVALIVAAVSWLGYYDMRAFGKPTTLPYTVDRATYATAPYYVWQSARPEPLYNHVVMRRFYSENELPAYQIMHTPSGYISGSTTKLVRVFLFYAGCVLLPPLFMLRRVLMDRRMRFLVLCAFTLFLGMSIQIFLIPHYVAPFTVVFYAIGLQGMRHLWQWKQGSQPVGRAIVRLTVLLVVALAGVRLFSAPLHMTPAKWPASEWSGEWYGPGNFGTERAGIESALEKLPGQQLVLVRYTADHNPLDEWVYNGADIDSSRVIWAREMDTAHNQELLRYYGNRHAWLVEPDAAKIQPVDYAAATPAPNASPLTSMLTSSLKTDEERKGNHD